MRHCVISLRPLRAVEDSFVIRLLFIKMVRLGEKAHLLMINLPPNQSLGLVQLCFQCDYWMKAIFAQDWAVAVVIKR